MQSLKSFITDKVEEMTNIALEPSRNALVCLKATTDCLTKIEKAANNIQNTANEIPQIQTALNNIDIAITSADKSRNRQVTALDSLITGSFTDLKKHIDGKSISETTITTTSAIHVPTKPPTQTPTFASILKGQKQKQFPTADYSIIIQPKNKTQTADITKQHILNNFDPVANKIGINRILKRKDGAVLINVDNECSLNTLQTEISKTTAADYNIKQTIRRNPRLQIVIIPKTYKDE